VYIIENNDLEIYRRCWLTIGNKKRGWI